MKFVNLTPHAVNVRSVYGTVITVPASGTVARCDEVRTPGADVESENVYIPVSAAEYGEVTGLPDPQDGVGYIVSSLVLAAVTTTRRDVFAPGPAIRDDKGQIIGCNGLTGTILYTFG